MFKPQWITKFRETQVKNLIGGAYNKTNVLPNINFGKEKKKKLSREEKERKLQRQKALAALSSF